MDTLGQRITYLRQIKGISQKKLADELGISSGNLSSYENNKFKPAADTIIAICKYFNISADWLLLGKEYDKNSSKDEEKIILGKNEIDLIKNIRNLLNEDKKIILLLIDRLKK